MTNQLGRDKMQGWMWSVVVSVVAAAIAWGALANDVEQSLKTNDRQWDAINELKTGQASIKEQGARVDERTKIIRDEQKTIQNQLQRILDKMQHEG